jgi:signal transduction histidine kinase
MYVRSLLGSSRRKGLRQTDGSRNAVDTLSAKLLQMQEEERRRIARELHDGINQQLAVIVIELGRLAQTPEFTPEVLYEQLEELRRQAIELSQDVRALSHRLHPAVLEHLGLIAALRSLCTRFSQREGIRTSFAAELCQPPDKDLSLCLYRIVQESLHNVAKHSHASTAEVRLRRSGDKLFLRIWDDGIGFTRPIDGKGPGIGLISMEERARLAGGDLQLRSFPGRGTTICVSIPLHSPNGIRSRG